MYSSGRSNKQVRLTKDDADFPSQLHHAAPFKNHLLVNRENAAGKPRPQVSVEPTVQFTSKGGVLLSFDPVPDLRESDGA